jgi:tetratricopeptide (TPR) repeat protein
MAVIAVIFLLPNPLNLSGTVVSRIAEGVEALANPYVRYYDWWITWEMIKAHPFIGIGLGDFKLEFLDYKAKFLQTPRGERYRDLYIPLALQAHNDYLQMWAELGTLGLLVIGALVFTVFTSGLRRAKRFSSSIGKGEEAGQERAEEKALSIILLLAGVLTFMGDAFFSFPLHLPASALCLIVLLAILDSRHLQAPMLQIRLQKSTKWALIPLASILVVSMITFAVRDFIADLYSTKGKLLYGASAWTEAKEPLERSLERDFQPKEALFYLGVIYAREGNLKKAKEALERSLASSPRVSALFNLGIIALAARDLEEALHYFDLVTRLDPTNLEYLYYKGEAFMLTGRREEGAEILEEVISKDASYHQAYMRLGEYYQEIGMGSKAAEYYLGALYSIKRKLESLSERVKQPGLKRGEQEEIRNELSKLKRDREAIESALQALQQGSSTSPP